MESRFERAGSLERPGVIGRVVRLLLGIWCLYLFWIHLMDSSAIANAAADDFLALGINQTVFCPGTGRLTHSSTLWR